MRYHYWVWNHPALGPNVWTYLGAFDVQDWSSIYTRVGWMPQLVFFTRQV